MTAVAQPLPTALPGTVLRLQLEVRWRRSVLVSRGFEQGVWAGPASHHPFPLEGFDCAAEGLSLATRDGDSYLVTPPPSAQPSRPVRLLEGMRCEWTQGELTLRAWVTREPQAVSLAWLWIPGGPLALLALWQLAKNFGVFFAVLLLLLPQPKTRLVVAAQPEPLRAVKVLRFSPEVNQAPLPDKPRDRLKLLMAGKRSNELFAEAGRRQAERERAKPPKVSRLREAQLVGVLAVLTAKEEPVDMLSVADLGEEGGVVGGVVGGIAEAEPVRNPAEEEARALAKSAGRVCFGDDDGVALMQVEVNPDGTASAKKLAGKDAVANCLKEQISSWRLPATPRGFFVTLPFRRSR